MAFVNQKSIKVLFVSSIAVDPFLIFFAISQSLSSMGIFESSLSGLINKSGLLFSKDLIDFNKAASNVLSIPITSPVAFI